VLQVGNGKTLNIATFPPTQGLLNILPYSDQYERSQTIWSPDGRHLVFTAYAKDGLPGIFVADSSGKNAPVKIASGDNATWSPK
jgi:Tol biopolymer transport system component